MRLNLRIQSVPRSKHSVSVIQASQLILYRKIRVIAVCSRIHTKHINTLRGQNVGLLCVKPGCTYSNHWASTASPSTVLSNSMCRSVCTSMAAKCTCREKQFSGE